MTATAESVASAAARLGVDPKTVRRMLADKTLTCIRVRRVIRIPSAEIDAIITGRPPKRR